MKVFYKQKFIKQEKNNVQNPTVPVVTKMKSKNHDLSRAGYLFFVVLLIFSIQFNASSQTCPSNISFTKQPLNQVICAGGSVDFEANITGAAGTANFDWQRKRPTDADFISIGIPSATIITIGNAGSIDDPDQTEYRVVITDDCGVNATISDTATLTVNSLPVVDPIADQAICNGASTTPIIFSSAVAGTTFNWTNSHPSIGLATSGSGDIASFSAVNTGSAPIVAIITVTPTANGCTGPEQSFTIEVKPTPNVDDPSDQLVCNNSPTNAVIFSGLVSGTTFNWTNNNLALGLPTSGTGNIASFVATNSGSTEITATITVTPLAEGCTGNPKDFDITVNPTPSVSATPASQTICSGTAISQINISNPNNVAGTTYSWSRTNTTNLTGIPVSGTGPTISGIFTNNTSTPQTTTFTIAGSAGNCTSITTVTVIVNPTPIVSATNTDQTICSGSAITDIAISNSNNIPGTTFSWIRDNEANLTGVPASGTESLI